MCLFIQAFVSIDVAVLSVYYWQSGSFIIMLLYSSDVADDNNGKHLEDAKIPG